VPGKKKATGMSTRQSFLDRNVIAENNAIMRFNEDIENAARGISRPRVPANDRGRERTPRRSERTAGPSRPARSPQPVRPPALLPEQEEALRTAVATATDDEAVARAGITMVESLARGDRFERAGDAGWRTLAEAGTAGERTLRDWDRLRLAWTAVRRAALAEWVKIHPEAAALQEKEEKAAARTERAATRRLTPRRSRPRRPASGVSVESEAGADSGEGQPRAPGADAAVPADGPAAGDGTRERRRRPRRRRPRQPASQPVEGTPTEPPPTAAETPADGPDRAEPPPPTAAEPAVDALDRAEPPPADALDRAEPPPPTEQQPSGRDPHSL